MNITVHQLNKKKSHCALCKLEIPVNQATAGEYVALITSPYAETQAYRVGEHNQEPLCTGAPAKEFSQKSIPLEKKTK